MRKLNRAAGWSLLLMVVFAPMAFGQNVNITLINGGPYTMDGISVGPYNATMNNQPTQIICDDYANNVHNNEQWTATVTQASSLTNTTKGLIWSGDSSGSSQYLGTTYSTLQGYDAMLFLASQMLPLSQQKNPNAQTIGYYAYAIWAIFDASAVYNYLQAHDTNFKYTWGQVQTLAENALKGSYTSGEFAGWEILTPVCSGKGCPQENLVFVPEGGTALMYLLLAGISCFGAFRFRARNPKTRAETA